MKPIENSEHGNISDKYPLQNNLKLVDALSPPLSRFSLEEVIKSSQVDQKGFKLNYPILSASDLQ